MKNICPLFTPADSQLKKKRKEILASKRTVKRPNISCLYLCSLLSCLRFLGSKNE